MKLEEALKSNKFTDEKHKAVLNILYSSYWLKTHFSTGIKEIGLTMEQYNIMRILKGMHPKQMCVKDIGSRMIEKNSNVPRIIDRLIIKKLVKRVTSIEDKRETLISLTENGILQLNEATKVLNTLTTTILGITDNQAFELNELLEKMRIVD